MAMDFFEHQEVARKKTGRLVILFTLAVIAIMVLVYLVVAAFVLYVRQQQGGAFIHGTTMGVFHPGLMAGVGIGTLAVVGFSSLYKVVELRSGGGAGLAQMLGGRLLDPGARELNDRKVLNVVEEMAIASGTPVPPVYVMENEESINAFAAGYSPDDAVIGVSRGSVEKLNRDELQGVVAHEFSHVLNGDMRLNIRLIGILYGILVIGLIGGMILRGAYYSGASSRRSSKEGGGAAAVLLLGLALMILGYVGSFFGKWIKSAVSRQREYLADASAVQFTRHPEGIGNALRKIGGSIYGSRIRHPRAEEASHMFFGSALNFHLFATHPPLPRRIGRVIPNWDGTFITPPEEREAKKRRVERYRKPYRQPAREGATADEGEDFAFGSILGGAAVSGLMGGAVRQIGRPTREHVDYAAEIIASIPAPLKEAAHEPFGARAVIYLLLLNSDAESRRTQVEYLDQHADAAVRDLVRKLIDAAGGLDERARLPLMDMCLPALRELSNEQRTTFMRNVDQMILADKRVEIHEWAIRRIILQRLSAATPAARSAIRYYNMIRLGDECSQLLSNLAYAGHREFGDAQRAFSAGAALLNARDLALLPFDQVGLAKLDSALDTLNTVAPRAKRQLIAACAAVIAFDREITVREGEMLRATSDVLGAPMPPILPGALV